MTASSRHISNFTSKFTPWDNLIKTRSLDFVPLSKNNKNAVGAFVHYVRFYSCKRWNQCHLCSLFDKDPIFKEFMNEKTVMYNNYKYEQLIEDISSDKNAQTYIDSVVIEHHNKKEYYTRNLFLKEISIRFPHLDCLRVLINISFDDMMLFERITHFKINQEYFLKSVVEKGKEEHIAAIDRVLRDYKINRRIFIESIKNKNFNAIKYYFSIQFNMDAEILSLFLSSREFAEFLVIHKQDIVINDFKFLAECVNNNCSYFFQLLDNMNVSIDKYSSDLITIAINKMNDCAVILVEKYASIDILKNIFIAACYKLSVPVLRIVVPRILNYNLPILKFLKNNCSMNSITLIDILLECGLDINGNDAELLWGAIKNNNHELCAFLLSKGADANIRRNKFIEKACKLMNLHIIQSLINNRVTVSYKAIKIMCVNYFRWKYSDKSDSEFENIYNIMYILLRNKPVKINVSNIFEKICEHITNTDRCVNIKSNRMIIDLFVLYCDDMNLIARNIGIDVVIKSYIDYQIDATYDNSVRSDDVLERPLKVRKLN